MQDGVQLIYKQINGLMSRDDQPFRTSTEIAYVDLVVVPLAPANSRRPPNVFSIKAKNEENWHYQIFKTVWGEGKNQFIHLCL